MQWTTRYQFETFYHPYARTFLRELEIGGIPRLMSRNLQLNPQTVRGWPTAFNFQSLYDPQPAVATPYPGTANAPDPGETRSISRRAPPAPIRSTTGKSSTTCRCSWRRC